MVLGCFPGLGAAGQAALSTPCVGNSTPENAATAKHVSQVSKQTITYQHSESIGCKLATDFVIYKNARFNTDLAYRH
jgi:hypothetical protein